jgi:integrase
VSALVGARFGETPRFWESGNNFCVRWLEAKSARLRPGVADHYAENLARHILPRLGQLRLQQVRRSDVEDWVVWAEQVKRPAGGEYASETVLTWWRLLTQILKDAAAEYGLTDATNRVRPPQKHTAPRRERRTLTPEQFTLFLQQAEAKVPERYAEIATLAMTGMRAGEVYGLMWSDIDEVEGLIRIQRSASHGHVTLTKTGDPREVPLPDVLRDILRLQKQSLLVTKHRGLATGLVFPADTGGHRIPQSLHKVTKDLAKRCGIAVLVGPQVLRRTFNTLMLRVGVDRTTLRVMMGHTTEAMTQRYAGVPLDLKHEAVGRLPAVSNEPDPKPVEAGKGQARMGLRVLRGGLSE